ncbi:MAG: DUF4105 domain-containing protein [Gemmatimonadales bacterium]|nr:DUF4105 domain-containing protein [Gemmatimonadales bacterium]
MPSARGTYWRIILLLLFCSIGGFGAIIFSRRPSNDRRWAADHARLPEVTFVDTLIRIANVRNFQYQSADSFTVRYDTRTYDLTKLESVWFVLAPFSTSWRGPAHSFVSFGFSDSTFLAISVEARREEGESYGVLAGMGRNFELIYVVGDEADLIGKRAGFGEFDVYLYPIRTTMDRAQAVLLNLLAKSDRLRLRPQFYHTVTNNCTSNLVASVNQVAPGRIPKGLKLVFPGYADEVGRLLGLIDSTLPLEQARARYRINDAARRAMGRPDFSLLIRDQFR